MSNNSPLIVGLTGGIGSGKSTVANMFQQLGVPIYIADEEAKNLMNSDEQLKHQIKKLFGEKAYINGELQRSFIASKVFKDKNLLQQLNAIVHPAVQSHFEIWQQKQRADYVIKEAAILFENGGYKQCDYTILIIAPKEIRIQRVQKRDQLSRSKILDRMQHQWDDSKKIALADFCINNDELEETFVKVKEIHNKIKDL